MQLIYYATLYPLALLCSLIPIFLVGSLGFSTSTSKSCCLEVDTFILFLFLALFHWTELRFSDAGSARWAHNGATERHGGLRSQETTRGGNPGRTAHICGMLDSRADYVICRAQ